MRIPFYYTELWIFHHLENVLASDSQREKEAVEFESLFASILSLRRCGMIRTLRRICLHALISVIRPDRWQLAETFHLFSTIIKQLRPCGSLKLQLTCPAAQLINSTFTGQLFSFEDLVTVGKIKRSFSVFLLAAPKASAAPFSEHQSRCFLRSPYLKVAPAG